MHDRQKIHRIANSLLVLVKASPYRACLSLFRGPKRVGLLVTAAILLVSMVGSGLLPATAVWADPNASGSCAESGGTTSQVNGITVCSPAQTIAQGFHRGLLVREMAAAPCRCPEPRVQRLDRVGRVNERASGRGRSSPPDHLARPPRRQSCFHYRCRIRYRTRAGRLLHNHPISSIVAATRPSECSSV